MYKIEAIHCEQTYPTDYIYKSRNEHGQSITLECYVFEEDKINNKIYWNVSFHIGKRKRILKDFEDMTTTGKDGIKSLLWAKNCIIDVRKNIKKDYKDYKNIICIYWTDKRRRDVYYKNLKELNPVKLKDHLIIL